MVAAIGEQSWPPQTSHSQTGQFAPAAAAWSWPRTARLSVDGYTLTLAANPWNIVRAYNFDGGADDVTLATGQGAAGAHAHHIRKFFGALQQPELRASASFTVGGFQLEGHTMTLSAFAWNIVRTYTLTPGRRYSFRRPCRARATSRRRRAKLQSCTSEPSAGLSPGWCRSAGTLDLCSMQIGVSAFEGESVLRGAQTKSLSTQLSREPAEPRLPCDCGQHGQRGSSSTPWGQQHKRPDMNGNLRLALPRTTLQKRSGRI